MKNKKLLSLGLATLLSVATLVLMNGQNVIAATTTAVGVSYSGHVENIGWQTPVSDGAEAGTDGKALRVEALKLNLTNAPAGAHISYQAHVENIGWQAPVIDGQEAGTDGKSLRVEALKISLENMPGYSVQYRAHVQNIGWQDWVADGQEAGTDGKALRVEALEIRIVKISDNTTVGVTYQGHVQNVGWQSSVQNGQIAGTEGQALRVEALKASLVNAPAGAKINYQGHVENIGWQTPTSDGAEIGTDGKALRVEAMKISLSGLPGYSVQYRAHVENIGWQPWVSDGQEAGTDGKALRIEAIEIRIVKTADGSTPTPIAFATPTPVIIPPVVVPTIPGLPSPASIESEYSRYIHSGPTAYSDQIYNQLESIWTIYSVNHDQLTAQSNLLNTKVDSIDNGLYTNIRVSRGGCGTSIIRPGMSDGQIEMAIGQSIPSGGMFNRFKIANNGNGVYTVYGMGADITAD